MEICSTNVTEFSSYIVYQWLQYIGYLGMEKGRVTLFISDYNVTPSKICGTNVAEFPLYTLFGVEKGRVTLFISDYNVTPSKICDTNCTEFLLYSLLYSQFGDGEGRGYTVCMLVDICQSNQWNSVAWMSQNFNYIVYSLFGDGEGRAYTVCTSVDICQSNQWNSAARMSQNFHHTLYISDYNVSPMVICCTIVTEF
jgi:hypothetical protein